MTKRRVSVAAFLMVLVCCSAGVGTFRPGVAVGTEAPTAAAPAAAAALELGEVLARARPAVVTVICTNTKGEVTQGSGVIVAPDGVVLTAWHVVAGAAKAQVKLASGKAYAVQGLVGWDASKDFALLKIAGAGLPTARLGDSDKVRQGDRVLTLGAPLGLEQTASDGIVSAVRDLPDHSKLLQTTAAISPGSSGGPILNVRAEVIGIACFLLTEGQSLNFGVPINEVKPALKRGNKVTPLGGVNRVAYAGSAEALYQQGIQVLPTLRDESAPDAQARFQKAMSLFRKAVEIREDDARAYALLGYCLVKLGRPQEAVDACARAVKLRPNLAISYFAMAMALYLLDRCPEALDACKQAVRLDPHWADALALLGPICAELGRSEEAVAACMEAVRIAPDSAAGHLGLGLAYLGLDRYQDAVDALKEAIRLKPDVGIAYTKLGAAYLGAERRAEAATAFKQAIRLTPDDAQAHYGLGLTYLLLGDRGRALDEYKILKDLNAGLGAELFKLLYP